MTARVQRDRPDPDAGALARLVVPGDVEHHLVGVDVRVVVGHRDGERVVVDLAGHEVADHEVVALEDLVHRRRLVHPAGDRLEVRDVEDVRVEAPVPSDHVERVLRQDVHRAGQPSARAGTGAAVLDVDLHVGPLHLAGRGRHPQVPLAVRRVLEQLPEPGQVAAWRRDVAVALDRVEAQRLPRHHPAVRGGARDDRVVTRADLEIPEDRLQPPLPGLDEGALVTGGVAVVGRGAPGDHIAQPHVAVAEQQPAAGHRVDPAGIEVGEELVRREVARQQRGVRHRGLVGQLPCPRVDQRGRNAPVVEQRGVGGEPLLAHQLLAVEAAVGAPVLGVPLGGHVSHPLVVRHSDHRRSWRAARPVTGAPGTAGPASRSPSQRLPRLSCSRSIASKRALKLPFPNPSDPCRSIISKKTVGRSPIGLVKICSR